MRNIVTSLTEYYESRKENLLSLRTFIGAHEVYMQHCQSFDSFKWFMANHLIPQEMSILSFYHVVPDIHTAGEIINLQSMTKEQIEHIGKESNTIIYETLVKRGEPVTMGVYQNIDEYEPYLQTYILFRFNFTYAWHIAHSIIRRKFAELKTLHDTESDEETMHRVFSELKYDPIFDANLFRPVTQKIQISVPDSRVAERKLSYYEAVRFTERSPENKYDIVTDLKDYGLFAVIRTEDIPTTSKKLNTFNKVSA